MKKVFVVVSLVFLPISGFCASKPEVCRIERGKKEPVLMVGKKPVATANVWDVNQNFDILISLKNKMVHANLCRESEKPVDCRIFRTVGGDPGLFLGTDTVAIATFNTFNQSTLAKGMDGVINLRDKLVRENLCRIPAKQVDCRVDRTLSGDLGLFIGSDTVAIATFGNDWFNADEFRDHLVRENVCKMPANPFGYLKASEVSQSKDKALTEDSAKTESVEQLTGSTAGAGR